MSQSRYFKGSSSLRLLYLLYYLSGGIFTSNKISKNIKILWVCYAVAITFFLEGVGGLGYLLTANTISIIPVIQILEATDTLIYIMFVLPGATYFFRREFETVLEYIEKNFSEMDDLKKEVVKVDTIKEVSYWLALGCSSALLFIFIGHTDIILQDEDSHGYHDFVQHIVPLPFEYLTSTMKTFILVYVIEDVLIAILLALTFLEISFTVMLASTLHNLAVSYCCKLETLSNFVTTPSNHSGCKWNFASVKTAAMPLHRVFDRHLFSLIKDHQELIKTISLTRPYMEICSSLTLMAIFGGYCFTIYCLLLDLPYVLKMRQTLALFMIAMVFYAHCEFGHKMNNVNEMITQEIYNLPWYQLPPTKRKLINLFLCQVQQPIVFRAFKIYFIDLRVFPRTMNMAYSYITLLRRAIITGHISSL